MNLWLLPIVHLFAVMFPGPDFFLVLKHSFLYSRRASIITAFGIASGCLIHMGTVVFMLYFLNTEIEWVSKTLKILGSGYLIFLGISSLKDFFKKKFLELESSEDVFYLKTKKKLKKPTSTPYKFIKKIHFSEFKTYFLKGFFCNLLNPKAWAYFFGIFTAIYSHFVFWEILFIVFIFFTLTQLWFSLVGYLFTLQAIKSRIEKYKIVVTFLCGIGFCFLGVKLLFY